MPLEPSDYTASPFRARAVEPIPLLSSSERRAALERASYNVFNLRSAEVTIDLLTDSGTGAMSAEQYAALMRGDEAYAGSRSFERLQAAVVEHFGLPHVLPCHQGRGAEHVAFAAILGPGDVVAGNLPFDTTNAHIAYRGAKVADCGIDAAADPARDHPFKGNVDLDRLSRALRGGARILLVTLTCNSIGGHPVSLANLQAATRMAHEHGVLVVLDVARGAENAWLVKQREPGQGDRPVRDVFRDQMDCADVVLMSAKKNGLVNIGGLIACRDRGLYERLLPHLILFEGFATYGGMAGRDVEALAVGLGEALDEAFLRHRTGQVAALHRLLLEASVPVVVPAGGHAVYIDASTMLGHLSRAQLPGIALTNELYLEGGVRAVEVGQVMDPGAPRDLVRLAVPSRTYGAEHMEYVARVVANVSARAKSVPGHEVTYKPDVLPHFMAKFAPLVA